MPTIETMEYSTCSFVLDVPVERDKTTYFIDSIEMNFTTSSAVINYHSINTDDSVEYGTVTIGADDFGTFYNGYTDHEALYTQLATSLGLSGDYGYVAE